MAIPRAYMASQPAGCAQTSFGVLKGPLLLQKHPGTNPEQK